VAQVDPFEDARPAALFPSMEQLAGRLVLVRPLKLTENIPSRNYRNPDGTPVMSERIDAEIKVVDGPLADFPSTEFDSMWVGGSYQVTQLKGPLSRKSSMLGRVQLKDPSKPKGQGNPWGFEPPTDQDKQIARDYLAGRTIGGAEAPAAAPAPKKNPFGN
jgi:hypothetical protein